MWPLFPGTDRRSKPYRTLTRCTSTHAVNPERQVFIFCDDCGQTLSPRSTMPRDCARSLTLSRRGDRPPPFCLALAQPGYPSRTVLNDSSSRVLILPTMCSPNLLSQMHMANTLNRTPVTLDPTMSSSCELRSRFGYSPKKRWAQRWALSRHQSPLARTLKPSEEWFSCPPWIQ